MENKDSGKLGLVACIAILTGGCIGSAIFSLSGMTMYYAGPAAIITWIVAAIILGCYGVQVAELSVDTPIPAAFMYSPQSPSASSGAILRHGDT